MWRESAIILTVVAGLLFMLLVVPYFTRPDMVAYVCSIGEPHEGHETQRVVVSSEVAALWFVEQMGERNALTPGEFAAMLRQFGMIRGRHRDGYHFAMVEGFTLNGVKQL